MFDQFVAAQFPQDIRKDSRAKEDGKDIGGGVEGRDQHIHQFPEGQFAVAKCQQGRTQCPDAGGLCRCRQTRKDGAEHRKDQTKCGDNCNHHRLDGLPIGGLCPFGDGCDIRFDQGDRKYVHQV